MKERTRKGDRQDGSGNAWYDSGNNDVATEDHMVLFRADSSFMSGRVKMCIILQQYFELGFFFTRQIFKQKPKSRMACWACQEISGSFEG